MLLITALRNTKVRIHSNSAAQDTLFCTASSHQGDPNLFSHHSVGRQCLPNSLIACVTSAIERPSNWTTDTMDYILQQGDNLYCNIDVGHELLLPSDLPTCVHINNRVCQVVRGKEAYGSFVENITETKEILFALCTFLQRTMTSALLCMGDQMGSSAVALLSSDTSLFIFDAHSRDKYGMPSPNGTSVLMQFSDIDQTVLYLCELAHSLSARLFHWTFWHALLDQECDCMTNSVISNPALDVLSADDIFKLYSDIVPKMPEPPVAKQHKRRKYYTSYKRKVRQKETDEKSTQRRLSDKIHKQTTRANETLKQSQERKQADKIQTSKTRLFKKNKIETIEDAMNRFKLQCRKQPVYVCTSCHRLLWKKGVQSFNRNHYNSIDSEVRNLVLAEKYRISSPDGSTYICHSCHNTLKSGTIPAKSKANFMDLEEIPDELNDLNNLELHTISKRILFMKLVRLPRGKQKGIKGAAVNVPADLGPACNLLPRIPTDAHIISLKLKRKLEYKQAYLHDTIQPEKVITAICYLKNHNPLYADIEINEDWIQTWQELDQELYKGVFDIEENCGNNEETTDVRTANVVQSLHDNTKVDANSSGTDASDNEHRHDNPNNDEKEDMLAIEENCKLRDLPCDTCLQSELPEAANQIFSIAPGEGNKPIPLLTDKLFEELANPEKFPSGKGGYTDTKRHTTLTIGKYVNA